MKDKSKSFEHGSVDVWDNLFDKLDLSYSEGKETQGKLFEMVKVEFLAQLFPKGDLKILEVGAGTGFVSLYFAKRGYRVTCLDTSAEILKVARKNFETEKADGIFFVGNAEKLPFENNQFDIVTSFGLLEHFKDPSIAIFEMSRVLKPGGLFFADIVPARFSCQFFGNVFNAAVSLLFWTIKGKPFFAFKKARNNFIPEYYENKFSNKEYMNFIAKAGLTKIKVHGNRPFPRLTLPLFLDKLYARILRISIPLWKRFDRSGNSFSKFWGAGWWFWAYK